MVVLVHDTLSRLLSMLPTSGLGMTDHADPFQDSTSVLPTAVPTAVQLVGLVQDTLSSWPELVVSCAMGWLGTAASTGMVIDTATTIETPTAAKIDWADNRKTLFSLIPSPPSQLVHWSVHCGLAWGKRPMETSRPQSCLFPTVAPQNRYGSIRRCARAQKRVTHFRSVGPADEPSVSELASSVSRIISLNSAAVNLQGTKHCLWHIVHRYLARRIPASTESHAAMVTRSTSYDQVLSGSNPHCETVGFQRARSPRCQTHE